MGISAGSVHLKSQWCTVWKNLTVFFEISSFFQLSSYLLFKVLQKCIMVKVGIAIRKSKYSRNELDPVKCSSFITCFFLTYDEY